MGVVLEIREGAMAGKVIALKTGESVTIGRAAGRAQFALPHDTFMSGVQIADSPPHEAIGSSAFLSGPSVHARFLASGRRLFVQWNLLREASEFARCTYHIRRQRCRRRQWDPNRHSRQPVSDLES